MEKANPSAKKRLLNGAAILLLLLILSLAANFFQFFSNPVRGYSRLYGSDTTEYQLYIRGKLEKQLTGLDDGPGRRIKYNDGLNYICKYRETVKDDPTKTLYISFSFDSVFDYMGYILKEYKPKIPDEKELGFRIYFAQDTILRPISPELEPVYQHMILMAPTQNNMTLKWTDEPFDFFDQGSICPIMCPDDVKLPLKCAAPLRNDTTATSSQ